MIERMTALLPAERQPLSRNIVPRRDNFEVLYHLHFDNLCADFQVCNLFLQCFLQESRIICIL